MMLNGRMAFAMSKRMLSMRKFSAVPNVTGREIQPCGITDTGPTLENGCDGWSFPIEIYNFLKVAGLMRLSATPQSIMMWYSLTLVMVGETSIGSCPTPTMLLW
jgi:hypothetical protein